VFHHFDGNRGSGTAHILLAGGARKVASPTSSDLEETLTLLMSLDDLGRANRKGDVPLLSMAAAVGLAQTARPQPT
jgi:hypothetical protein